MRGFRSAPVARLVQALAMVALVWSASAVGSALGLPEGRPSALVNTTYPSLSLSDNLLAAAQEQGAVRVILQLNIPFQPEGGLPGRQAIDTQRQAIRQAQNQVLQHVSNARAVTTFAYIPFMALEVDAATLITLSQLLQVLTIEEDAPTPLLLNSSVPVVGANEAWYAGYRGAGQAVAILDTGVDFTHPAFNNTDGVRVVSEACYSTGSAAYGSISLCPDQARESVAPGSGADCVATLRARGAGSVSTCAHGTHVAGIAAGNDGLSVVGVAPDAGLISIQVFSLFTGEYLCGGSDSCLLSYVSDQIKGLERVYELSQEFEVAAVNMSLGGGAYTSAEQCDQVNTARKWAIDNLRSVGVATVVAAGNGGRRDSLSAPACISTAVSVAATNNSDQVASFSNVAPFLSLLAPGVSIYSALPEGSAGVKHGTSMAAPHVAGAWAIFKQAMPEASVEELLTLFQVSGVPVSDGRPEGMVTAMRRIDLPAALDGFLSDYEFVFAVEPAAQQTQRITTPDQALSIDIPAGVLPPQARKLVYKPQKTTTADLPVPGIGPHFDLSLIDAQGVPIPHPTFAQPLSVTVKYNPARLPPGIEAGLLTFFYYHPARQRWEHVPIVARNVAQHTITVQLDHFSQFALAGPVQLFLPLVAR